MPFETISIEDVPGAQIIKIPNDFKIDDDKVYLKKVGNSLHIIPFHNSWQNMIESLGEFTPDFMNDCQQPNRQTRESFD